jgi:hypothetical protein
LEGEFSPSFFICRYPAIYLMNICLGQMGLNSKL